jgi:hypothetical protein
MVGPLPEKAALDNMQLSAGDWRQHNLVRGNPLRRSECRGNPEGSLRIARYVRRL